MRQSHPLQFMRLVTWCLIAMAGWTVMSWLFTSQQHRRQLSNLLTQETLQARHQLDSASQGIERTLTERGAGIAATLAANDSIRDSVQALHTDQYRLRELPAEERSKLLVQHPRLQHLNQFLQHALEQFRLASLWIGNAQGDCIATGRPDKGNGCLGVNYADRPIYTAARNGHNGLQFAIGRKTGAAGIFFSAPIQDRGRFIGMVVVKIDVADLSPWIDSAQALLSDRHGVIVLSPDNHHLMQALPGATVQYLTGQERQQLYRRDEFPTLEMQPWATEIEPPAPAELVQVENSAIPALRESRTLGNGELTLTLLRPQPRLIALQDQHRVELEMLQLIGWLMIGILGSGVYAFANIRHTQAILIRQKKMLDDAQRLARLGSWDLDIGNDRLQWSDEVAHLLGVPSLPTDANYASLLAMIHPEDRWGTDLAYRESVDHGRPFHRTCRVLVEQGQVRHVEIRCETQYDAAGHPLRSVGTLQDVTDRKEAEAEIHSLAFYDPLTQLPNRRMLIDRLQQRLSHTRNERIYRALLFLDLDNFKTLNDTMGHDVGDRMLVEVSHRLQQCVHASDTISRLGGDEFVVLLEHLSESVEEATEQAADVGWQIVRRLSEPYHLGTHLQHRSSASVGITLFGPEDHGVEEVMKRGDLAMYQAKADGRNMVRFYAPEMQASLSERLNLEHDIFRDLNRREFILHYQPQVDGYGRCVGAEALVRWNHPVRGWVSPADFIPIAEDTGLIEPLGHWVIELALQQLIAWQSSPETTDLSLAVNVSSRQFMQDHFVDDLTERIDRSGINPARLHIEITESVFLENLDEAILKMGALKAVGLHFSLDDFGTGYSSLSYLKRLPLDLLKIDGSFVRDVLTHPSDASICRAIIALGQSLGLQIIAEGVEHPEQWNFLSQEGCHYAQGYLFGRPMCPTDFMNWLQQRQPVEGVRLLKVSASEPA